MDYFIEEHEKMIPLMLRHEVEFIIIGGFAVVYLSYRKRPACGYNQILKKKMTN